MGDVGPGRLAPRGVGCQAFPVVARRGHDNASGERSLRGLAMAIPSVYIPSPPSRAAGLGCGSRMRHDADGKPARARLRSPLTESCHAMFRCSVTRPLRK